MGVEFRILRHDNKTIFDLGKSHCINGEWVDRDQMPTRIYGALVSQIKVLANLDLAERQKMQEGVIHCSVPDYIADGDFDIQVTLLPDQKHERVILRFPNAPQDAPLGHDDYLEAVAALLAMDEPPVVTDVVSLDLIQFVVEQAKASQ